MKEYRRQIPIFPLRLCVCITRDPAEIVDRFSDLPLESNPGLAGTFENEGWLYACFVACPDLTPGVVAHECAHLVNALFRVIGYEPQRDNDEVGCYLLTWFMDKIHVMLENYCASEKEGDE